VDDRQEGERRLPPQAVEQVLKRAAALDAAIRSPGALTNDQLRDVALEAGISASAVHEELKRLGRRVERCRLGEQEKRRLREGLGNLKSESIGESCRQLVMKHGSVEDVKYFRACYQARSDLVHYGKTARPEATDATRLDVLVSQLPLKDLSPAS
jgi:hypothetical protein